ncbi:hypothetical protein N7495_003447 [Penicillium taxi]|uniref:uncharacterized protein n=1 Tax=Penicillium taxi TaxID=168475 RepID=UPI0025458EFB|nr:uncharacterized protein N7495_003447 [Penicillium taxi]KAJ5902919.1 hypothetical protein N7495_003447 [Penicillium taxi]
MPHDVDSRIDKKKVAIMHITEDHLPNVLIILQHNDTPCVKFIDLANANYLGYDVPSNVIGVVPHISSDNAADNVPDDDYDNYRRLGKNFMAECVPPEEFTSHLFFGGKRL